MISPHTTTVNYKQSSRIFLDKCSFHKYFCNQNPLQFSNVDYNLRTYSTPIIFFLNNILFISASNQKSWLGKEKLQTRTRNWEKQKIGSREKAVLSHANHRKSQRPNRGKLLNRLFSILLTCDYSILIFLMVNWKCLTNKRALKIKLYNTFKNEQYFES